MRTKPSNRAQWVAHDVAFLQIILVNVGFIGNPGTNPAEWILVDTGLPQHENDIYQAASDLFGANIPPKAIILTQGHFDHVGTVNNLANSWNITVYAHPQEIPYLTGQTDYPSPDPSVSDGLLAKMSSMFPHQAIDLGTRVQPLPDDGSIPFMPGWRWLHTPGHTPGHIALFRDEDRVLLAGDAFTTVKQESAEAVERQITEIHGPPAYLTTNWSKAWDSVRLLEGLKPEVVISSHGQPMRGDDMRKQLRRLVDDFDILAIPDQGIFVQQPMATEIRPRF